MIQIELKMPRGTCPAHLFGADVRSAAPVFLMFPDAFGPRPASFAVADALAQDGVRVLMIDNFYDQIPYEPIQPSSIFAPGPGRERLYAMLGGVTQAKIDADTVALTALAAERFGPDAPLAAVGYCMGGRYALTCAGLDARFRLAASIHGSDLAPADGDGPHRRFGSAAGRIYVAVAGVDPTYDAAEHGRLASALRDAMAEHVLETYGDTAHGFAFADLPVHHPAAAARHLDRLRGHLREMIAA